MITTVPAGVPLSFDGAFPGISLPAFVGFSIYDQSNNTLVAGPTAMTNVVGAAYSGGGFKALPGKSYLVFIAAYTDMAMTLLDPNWGPITGVIRTDSSNSVGCNVVGLIDAQNVCWPARGVFTIFLGDQKTMPLKAIYAESGDPLDLTNCTAIVVTLRNADGTPLTLTLASGAVAITGPANLGKFTALITTAQSTLLNPGPLQDFDVTFTFVAGPFTVRYANALTVNES